MSDPFEHSQMGQWFGGLDAERRGSCVSKIALEVEALIGVRLPVGQATGLSYSNLVRNIARWIDEAVERRGFSYDRVATRALLSSLTSESPGTVTGFVDDLAEILFLERERRTEYASNREIAPPFKIGKLLLEYAVKSRQLDRILGELTKGYCATRCDRLPIGCCSIDGFDMGLVPAAMLEVQEIEARRLGWDKSPSVDVCKFHSHTGCVIALFKSPACIGMLCEPLIAVLREWFAADRLEPFLEQLAEFRNCDIDRVKIFDVMDAVITASGPLVVA